MTIRLALRALRNAPAFALGAVVTVALTVGSTTAIFSVIYGILLRPLPYREPERVYWIWSDQTGRDRAPFNVPDFIDYRDAGRTLDGLAGFFAFSANLSDEAAAERVQGLRASGNFFEVLGARARLGRLLQAHDERPEAGAVVVITEPFWVRRFGGDPSIVGQPIRLNGENHTVVGVIGAGFVTPVRDVDFVVPFAADRDPLRGARNSVNFINGVGRLGEHISRAQAAGELNQIARQLQQRFPVENARKNGVRMVGVIDGVAGPFRTTLLTIFAAVGAVLLIACANLANLMLTRAHSRRRDLAVQLALGGAPSAIASQSLVEALLVAGLGGVLGIVVAKAAIAGFAALAPVALPRIGDVRVDLTALAFSLIVSLAAAVLFGLVPALASARVDVREALQDSSRGATAGGARMRGALVSVEVAIAVLLLVVMTLLARSLANVQAVAPGFDPTRVLSARLTLPARRFDNREAIVTFQRALSDRLSSLPGVTQTGAISLVPLSGLLSRVPFTVEGRPIDRERVPLAQFRIVSTGYFETARIPLERGRTFSERDTGTTTPVAVVNQALARQWFGDRDPLGARLLVDDNNGPPRPVEIIGVVGNVRQIALDDGPTWDLYLTYPQIHADTVAGAAANIYWLVRTSRDASELSAALAREVHAVDSEVAASQIAPMARYLSESIAPRRFSLSMIATFSVAALALAITGVYAVITYSVNQRRRELAIRSALGASGWNILRLVMGQGLAFILVGLVAGLSAAVVASRLLTTLLFGLAATDAVSFVVAAAVVLVAALIACVVPALRVSGNTPRLS